MCPSVSSIGDRIFVVWNSDRRFGDFDIFLCEFDGENCLSTQCIARQDTPEFNPSVTAYRGWHLSSLGYTENLMVAWESVEEGRVVCHFSTAHTLKPAPQLQEFHLEERQNTDLCFPVGCYVSRYKPLNKILKNDLWLVWQCSEPISRKSDIQCKDRSSDEIPISVTDDFSRNERPQIVEFKGIQMEVKRVEEFTTSAWKGKRFLDIRSKGGVRKIIVDVSNWMDRLFHRHIGSRDVIIGVSASLLAYVLLHFLETFLSFFFG